MDEYTVSPSDEQEYKSFLRQFDGMEYIPSSMISMSDIRSATFRPGTYKISREVNDHFLCVVGPTKFCVMIMVQTSQYCSVIDFSPLGNGDPGQLAMQEAGAGEEAAMMNLAIQESLQGGNVSSSQFRESDPLVTERLSTLEVGMIAQGEQLQKLLQLVNQANDGIQKVHELLAMSLVPQQPNRIFVSHSGEEKHVALCVARLLNKRQMRPWIDIWDCRDSNARSIYGAVRECATFLAITSKGFFRSEWCLKELGCAESNQKKILCLRTDEMRLKEHPGTSVRGASIVDEVKELFDKHLEMPLTVQETGDLAMWMQSWMNKKEGGKPFTFQEMAAFVGVADR